MEAIKAADTTHGRQIPDVLGLTFQIFTPLIEENEAAIRSVKHTTHSYGSTPRQELDLFPSTSSLETSPILIFFHGGGLIRGDKKSPNAKGLVYANLASFFAQRGITTINPNYRLVNSVFGGHDAVFPSGGEDVSLVLKWLERYTEGTKRDVYIMGNSAGGVHMSTFLFLPQFLEQRQALTAGSGNLNLRGVVELAVPCNFKNAAAERSPMLQTYYGEQKEISERCPHGLLEQLKGNTKENAGVPKCLALIGEFDPHPEIVDPMNEFVELWKSTFGNIEYETMPGHNHISPTWALFSGDKKGEAWGEKVARWIKS